MNFIKNNLANAITLGNLLSGCIGAIHLISGDYQTTAVCIVLSLILDFFDGFTARALKANSNLGTQLDSLADMVSFGLVPGLTIVVSLLGIDHRNPLEAINYTHLLYNRPQWVTYLGFLITLFSCLRLAIFNLDEEQKYYFKGLNTPSNTILIFGLFYANKELGTFEFLFENQIYLLILTAISSWLLISPIKMIAMKFKSMKLQDNYPKIALLVGSVIILAIFKTIGIPLVIIYYILISIIFQKQLK
ncbi:CDP-alcohol phosphatidyltransferase family protein [Chryseobacterium mucoviscidosis]|uniref:CDP-alcohol phosphatidyltransferase n=1 Tax=Chryseobacterium mucoviscidosis TaxID=1945581 RepID=A0A202CGB0_9FLAO|nr:CDP-alcohol phosphatidyltransferase family protein [Chryseobacterium mucoviscidosis]OVE62826.1 CDP-alcohol phosphatidyltransferase [Chryseobacterium mucoviscidosis]